MFLCIINKIKTAIIFVSRIHFMVFFFSFFFFVCGKFILRDHRLNEMIPLTVGFPIFKLPIKIISQLDVNLE